MITELKRKEKLFLKYQNITEEILVKHEILKLRFRGMSNIMNLSPMKNKFWKKKQEVEKVFCDGKFNF